MQKTIDFKEEQIMQYVLGIVWDDGTKEIHHFLTREEAEEVERGYRTAFGKQINYSWVTRRA